MRNHMVKWLSFSVVVIVLDQLSKWYVTQGVIFPNLYGTQGQGLIDWLMHAPERLPFFHLEMTSYFNLVMAWNTGVSFSLFSDGGVYMPFVLIAVALVIVGMFIYWLWKADDSFQCLCYALVIGGALGNVIDRARFGAVIDFLDFHAYGHHWPAFNVADMAVVTGIVLLIGGSLAFDLHKKWRYRRGMKIQIFGFICLSFTLALSGCGGLGNIKNSLGLEKDAPDEFAVLTRAPLEVPPHMILPPPVPGQPRPQEQAAIAQAQQAVFGTEQQKTVQTSSAEEAFLQKAGAKDADPAIHARVNNETREMTERNLPVAQKLINLGSKNVQPSATVVDPKAELERLRKNKAEGKSVSDGETPFIEE